MKRLGLLACLALIGAADAPGSPVVIPVAVAPALGDHFSGRLIVFAEKAKPDASRRTRSISRRSNRPARRSPRAK